MRCYHTYSDQDLLERLSKNDELAFTELYNRYWKRLFAVAYSRLKQVEASEDVVHDVFASLWTNRNKVSIESLESYLATSAKYIVLGKIKRSYREAEYINSGLSHTRTESMVEESLHHKRILELVRREVNRLPDKCRLIFVNSRDHGKSVKQIAAELEISPKTVENQLNKALKTLRLVTRTIFLVLISAIASIFVTL
jgi:RNA polymerase sigma-70 factor (ECF subfamily)